MLLALTTEMDRKMEDKAVEMTEGLESAMDCDPNPGRTFRRIELTILHLIFIVPIVNIYLAGQGAV
jgi:hypothetical protein